MDWRAVSDMQILGTDNDISPIAAKTIADLELDETMYKPDFEITEKFQGFSKELVRISLLGLGVYGFLIKLGTEEKGTAQKFLMALQQHKFLAGTGVAAFALCAGCALFHGYETARCGFKSPLGRMLSDHKPNIARIRLDFWCGFDSLLPSRICFQSVFMLDHSPSPRP